ncbi:AraC family transcriptional regulator [Bacillus lacus]|uniref:AraC family transcriptional regulator n=1 Tax=Metabacillus lacus TaxID=1983721 RepID=A0A7X2J2Q5_9BACI|nr:AraC family transcriptional regulator [Metabacillus lacus]MRX73498.1 AraC family transcriptional regulator [Metabacillus lacus]
MGYISFHVPPFPVFIKGGEDRFNEGTKHFKRIYTVFDLLYVKKGLLYMTEDNREYTIKEGEYIILAPGLEHFGHKNSPRDTRIYWIHFTIPQSYLLAGTGHENWSDVQTREGDFEHPSSFHFKIPRYAEVVHRDFIEKILENLFSVTGQTPDFPLRQQLYFEELLVQLQKEALKIPTAAERVVEETLKFLQKHYQKDVRMEDLAKEIHFHPDYITRCMQKTLGMTPVHYVNVYRISQAKRLLATTDYKISAVAGEVGIEDSTYFSKLFKKIEGVSPLEFRKIVSRRRK